MSLKQTDSPRRLHFAVLALMTLPTLVFLNTRGSPDMKFWRRWADLMMELGPVRGYHQIWMDYPPLASQFLGVAAWFGSKTGMEVVMSIKCSLIVALWISTLVFWLVTRHFWGTVLMYVSLALHSASLGYLDIYYVPFLLGALAALAKKRHAWFAILYGCACLVKWQPLIMAPFLVLHILRAERQGLGWVGAGGQTLLKVALPLALLAAIMLLIFGRNTLEHALYITFRGPNHRALSMNALNLPWIVSHTLEWLKPGKFVGVHGEPVTLLQGEGQIMMLTSERIQVYTRLPFAAAYLFVLYTVWRSPLSFASTVKACILGYFSYFMLATGVHENHMLPVVLCALYLFAMGGVGLETPVILALMMNGNLLMFYGWDGHDLAFGRAIGDVVDVGLCMAIGNVILGTLLYLQLRKEIRSGGDLIPAAAAG